MIIPSAPLSMSVRALILRPEIRPMRLTRNVMDGVLLFRVVDGCTGFESLVTKGSKYSFPKNLSTTLLIPRLVPIDSAAMGRFKNPSCLQSSWRPFVYLQS